METGQILPALGSLSSRLLDRRERPYSAKAPSLPLVFEATGKGSASYLAGVLQEHSVEFKAAVYKYGAVLMRGFDIGSESDFSLAISSIGGVKPMTSYFMRDPGRSAVKGSANVFYTSTFSKTGGGFHPLGGGFHSENYYTLDTPAFQSFWCKKPPWFGGETALIHVAKAYDNLSPTLQTKLEADPTCTPIAWRVSDVAKVYGIPEEHVEVVFAEVGLRTISVDDQRWLVIRKPHVYWHPHTQRVTLSANLSELPQLDSLLRAYLEPHYSSSRWFLHRLAWRHPSLNRILAQLDNLPLIARHHPTVVLRDFWMGVTASLRRTPDVSLSHDREHERLFHQLTSTERLRNKVTDAEVQSLATALWNQYSAFTWKKGDVLIWDNLQTLHTGMPGLGPRELRVMLCNPIPVQYPLGPGPARISPDDNYLSVDERLRGARSTATAS